MYVDKKGKVVAGGLCYANLIVVHDKGEQLTSIKIIYVVCLLEDSNN